MAPKPSYNTQPVETRLYGAVHTLADAENFPASMSAAVETF